MVLDRLRTGLATVTDPCILEFPRFLGHLSACVRTPRKDVLHAEVACAVAA